MPFTWRILKKHKNCIQDSLSSAHVLNTIKRFCSHQRDIWTYVNVYNGYFLAFFFIHSSTACSEAVGRRFLTAEIRILSQGNLSGIYKGENGTGTGRLPSTFVSPVTYRFINFYIHPSIVD
jgi:hypothetical protein